MVVLWFIGLGIERSNDRPLTRDHVGFIMGIGFWGLIIDVVVLTKLI